MRRVHGADEVDGVVSDVHDVFVGAYSIERGHLIVGKLVRFDFQPPA